MQRSGQVGEDGTAATRPRSDAPEQRRPRGNQPGAPRRRATPKQFLHEVNVELRKVVWPTKAETFNYSSVVLVTLAVLMALIFGLDLGFNKLAIDLFK